MGQMCDNFLVRFDRHKDEYVLEDIVLDIFWSTLVPDNIEHRAENFIDVRIKEMRLVLILAQYKIKSVPIFFNLSGGKFCVPQLCNRRCHLFDFLECTETASQALHVWTIV